MALVAAGDSFSAGLPFSPGDMLDFFTKAFLAAAVAHVVLAFAVRHNGERALRIALAANAAFVLLDLAAASRVPFALLVLVGHGLAVVLLWREVRDAAV